MAKGNIVVGASLDNQSWVKHNVVAQPNRMLVIFPLNAIHHSVGVKGPHIKEPHMVNIIMPVRHGHMVLKQCNNEDAEVLWSIKGLENEGQCRQKCRCGNRRVKRSLVNVADGV